MNVTEGQWLRIGGSESGESIGIGRIQDLAFRNLALEISFLFAKVTQAGQTLPLIERTERWNSGSQFRR
jgi:hypothetical protein